MKLRKTSIQSKFIIFHRLHEIEKMKDRHRSSSFDDWITGMMKSVKVLGWEDTLWVHEVRTHLIPFEKEVWREGRCGCRFDAASDKLRTRFVTNTCLSWTLRKENKRRTSWERSKGKRICTDIIMRDISFGDERQKHPSFKTTSMSSSCCTSRLISSLPFIV